jgi:hypothetical protein
MRQSVEMMGDTERHGDQQLAHPYSGYPHWFQMMKYGRKNEDVCGEMHEMRMRMRMRRMMRKRGMHVWVVEILISVSLD